jgi:hypothetical protein
MNDKITKKEILVFAGIFAVMIGMLLYGFFALEIGQIENCWDNYTTEQEAIMACEEPNE